MSEADVQFQVQAKLAEARHILMEAAKLIDENHLGDIQFMGMVYESHVGWFTPDGQLQEESEWNESACVIGSQYAEGYGMDGWKSISPHDFGSRDR